MIKVLIYGGTGLAGSAFKRLYESLDGYEVLSPSRDELDLSYRIEPLIQYLHKHTPDIVIDAAAYVGGILINSDNNYDFLYRNLTIQNNIIESFRLYQLCENKGAKFVFLGSTCIYPREDQYMAYEEDLLGGPLEPSNKGYALAKIAGITMTQALPNSYSIMPCNLFGINDTYDLYKSHVLPSLILKTLNAKARGEPSIKVGGLDATRQFLFSDDLAREVHKLITTQKDIDIINLGAFNIGIKELAEEIIEEFYPGCIIEYDDRIPMGVLSKEARLSKAKRLGLLQSYTSLKEGLRIMKENCPKLKNLL